MDERKEKRRRIFRKCCHIFNVVAAVLVFVVYVMMFCFGMAIRRA